VSNKAKPGIYVLEDGTYRSVMLMLLWSRRDFWRHHARRVSAIYRFKLKAAGSFTGKVLEKVAGLAPPFRRLPLRSLNRHTSLRSMEDSGAQANGNSWIHADYNVPLKRET